VTAKIVLIGDPVAQSVSPAFQTAALEHCGFDARYEPWPTPADTLPSRVAALRSRLYLGANVTIPHKKAVIPLLDETGDRALESGAVNTIVNREGRLFGFNTDGAGFVDALRSEAEFEPEGTSILLLGAGGAARGIAFALAAERASSLAIANRTPDRAAALARDLSANRSLRVSVEDWVPSLASFDCVINCTSIGMAGGPEGRPACDFELARPHALIADIVYNPFDTPFLAAAREAGLRTLPGLPMLVRQGAIGFELWTGVRAPVDVMFKAARAALAGKQPAPGTG
jgi:shikimate dehydrogenase